MKTPSFLKVLHDHKSSWFILLLGCCYLLFLALSIQPDTFFSGDGGMKYLVVKQLHAGEGFKTLHLSQPAWVQEIWGRGFFPFDKPFVYSSAQGYIFSFPPAFQVCSAPLYTVFGYTGLYLIPLLSTVLLWTWVLWLFNLAKTDAFKKNLGLFVLIFCAPLTVYGAVYWEHMPAVLLLFGGVVFMVANRVSLVAALAMGLLSGMAVWLRPETIIMNFLYGAAILFFYLRQRRSESLGFLAGMLIPIAGFFLFNKMEYGVFLGAHSYQFIEEHSLVYKLMRGVKYAGLLNWDLVKYFSIVLLLLPVIYNILKRKWPVDRPIGVLLLIIILFCGLTPFMVPNTGGGQWGPRYLLPVIPLIVVVLVLAWQHWQPRLVKFSMWLVAFMSLSIAYCLFLNVYKGGMGRIRTENYTRVKPALDFVKQQPEQNIIVNTQFIPMEMSGLFDDRYFYVAENGDKLKQLLNLLKAKGITNVLYIADPGISEPPALIKDNSAVPVKKGNYYILKYIIR